ncbi:MAG TPA: hypothetical protein VF266_23730 [Thermoanaerobaculia bacterium]
MPEIAIDSIDPECEIRAIHDPAELLGRPVVPEPHPEEDLARINSDDVERIKRRVRSAGMRERPRIGTGAPELRVSDVAREHRLQCTPA